MNKELYIHTIRQFRDECEKKHLDTEVEAFDAAIKELERPTNVDCIDRQMALNMEISDVVSVGGAMYVSWRNIKENLERMPSAQPEPLTDKEQRIFLAAMGREEKVCEEVDRNHVREPYEDSLMSVCREIRRKVKGALWT